MCPLDHRRPRPSTYADCDLLRRELDEPPGHVLDRRFDIGMIMTETAISPVRSTSAAGVVTQFLRDVLAGGALDVPELEVRARAVGLLGEHQRITNAKLFRYAKKSLGIRSIRNGFGSGGEWLWSLEKQPAQPDADPSGARVGGPLPIGDTYAEHQDGIALIDDPKDAPADSRTRNIPSSWIDGVERLDYQLRPTDIPPLRWRQFLDDCNKFLNSSEDWAERAAELGWDAIVLFGCCPSRPLSHSDRVGLLWAINGGRLVELHRDWAVIELAVNRSRRVFERRRVDAAKVTLPWTEGRDRSGA
jgi:hypothetical protein